MSQEIFVVYQKGMVLGYEIVYDEEDLVKARKSAQKRRRFCHLEYMSRPYKIVTRTSQRKIHGSKILGATMLAAMETMKLFGDAIENRQRSIDQPTLLSEDSRYLHTGPTELTKGDFKPLPIDRKKLPPARKVIPIENTFDKDYAGIDKLLGDSSD